MQAEPELSVVGLCALAGMTPQNYYARRVRRQRQEVEVGLALELVRAERARQPRLGGRKLYYLIAPELHAAGVWLGRDRFFRELSRAGLLVPRKPSLWPKTTTFDPNLPVFKNLIRNRRVTGPNQVWAADITYVRTQEGFLYLALITDHWSRKIVGYHLGRSLKTEEALKALAMALGGLQRGQRPVHHSDRGCQYASHAYAKKARLAGLSMSMTERDHAAENALAERVNGILKQEYWLDANFANERQARAVTRHGIELYNNARPHSSLSNQFPAQVHARGQAAFGNCE